MSDNEAQIPYRYANKEKDKETGLQYFEQRYLSNQMGRFISPDPVYATAQRLINPQYFNPYSYAYNNPYRYIDPDGREPEGLDQNGSSTLIGENSANSASQRVDFQNDLYMLLGKGILNPGKLYDSPDEAAAVLSITALLSKKYNLEVSGNIKKDGQRFKYTFPEIGGEGSAKASTRYIGYHAHPGGELMFSNTTNNFAFDPNRGDSVWVEAAKKPLYLGVEIGGKVSVGVCEYQKCSNVGRKGTPPTRVIQ